MKKIHPTQKEILKKLLFTNASRYADLKPIDMEGSQFKFHLDTLKDNHLVQKDAAGKYSLTATGKEFANRFDFDDNESKIQAKHSVVMCGMRENGDEILVYKRLKNPFFGCQGFPTGKVRLGESIVDTAKREFTEETNLTGIPTLIGIRRYRVYPKNSNELLEDKVMYIFRIENITGQLKSNKEGEFRWIKIDEVDDCIEKPLEEFPEVLSILTNFKGEITFKEVDHYTSNF